MKMTSASDHGDLGLPILQLFFSTLLVAQAIGFQLVQESETAAVNPVLHTFVFTLVVSGLHAQVCACLILRGFFEDVWMIFQWVLSGRKASDERQRLLPLDDFHAFTEAPASLGGDLSPSAPPMSPPIAIRSGVRPRGPSRARSVRLDVIGLSGEAESEAQLADVSEDGVFKTEPLGAIHSVDGDLEALERSRGDLVSAAAVGLGLTGVRAGPWPRIQMRLWALWQRVLPLVPFLYYLGMSALFVAVFADNVAVARGTVYLTPALLSFVLILLTLMSTVGAYFKTASILERDNSL